MSDQNKLKIYIADILQAIDHLEKLTEAFSNAESFYEDWKSFQAAERNLQIIGEVVKNLPADIKSKYDEIAWQNIVDMRNLVVHEYQKVDPEIFWKAIHYKIPELKAVILKIKEAYD